MVVASSSQKTEPKRLSFILSPKAYADLALLSEQTSRSMTEILRLGLGLAKIAIEARSNGELLVVAKPDGSAVKEILLPN
jgi:hypothetical protein